MQLQSWRRWGAFIVVISALVSLTATPVRAQDDKKPTLPGKSEAADAKNKAAKPKKAAKREAQRGHLPPYYRDVVDDKQRETIYGIQQQYTSKIDALKAQLKTLTDERDAKVAAVLTPAQQKKIAELQAEAKKKRPAKSAPATLSGKTDEKKPDGKVTP